MNSNNENKEYELINLEREYPGIKGGVKWAVISDSPMDELMRKYGCELEYYSPVILLTVEQGEAFKEFHRNDVKHAVRTFRSHDSSMYEDSKTEEGLFNDLQDYRLSDIDTQMEYQYLRDLIEALPEVQKRRCKLYFYHGFSEEEIAKIEGVEQSSVSRALSSAIKNLKKLF